MAVSLALPQSGYDAELFYFLGTHLRAIYWHSSDLTEMVQAACGEGLIHTQYTDIAYLPAYHVVIMRDWILVVIEGMTFGGQLFRNIMQGIPASYEGYPGKVCPFYGDTVLALLQLLYNFILANLGDRKIIIAGHSYGGATATLLSHRLSTLLPGKVEAAIVYGAPRCGNADFRAGYSGILRRLQNVEDPICLLPPNFALLFPWPDGATRRLALYTHAGIGWDLHPDGSTSLGTESGVFDGPYAPARVRIEGASKIPGHDMVLYCDRLRKQFHRPGDRPGRFPRPELIDKANDEMDRIQGIRRV